MSNFTAMREALRAALPGDLQAEVLTGPQESSQTFGGGLGPPRMLIRIYVGSPQDPAAQKRLDALLDADQDGSIADCLYGSEVVEQVLGRIQIVSASGWRIYETNDGQVLGAELAVQTY